MKRHRSNQFDDAKSLIVKRTELNEVYNPARSLLQRQLAEVGQTSAPNKTSKLHSVLTTDARSRFRAEVKMTDASSRFSKLSSDDATDRTETPNRFSR